MSQLSADRGLAVGRKEASHLEPRPQAKQPAPVPQVTDEEIDDVFAAVTSQRPPPPSTSIPRPSEHEVVGVEDINEYDSVTTAVASPVAPSEPPPASVPPPPRPRLATLVGMSPPKKSSFPPAPMPELRGRAAMSTLPPIAPPAAVPPPPPRPSVAPPLDVRSEPPTPFLQTPGSTLQAHAFSLRPPEATPTLKTATLSAALKARISVAGRDFPLWAGLASVALPLVVLAASFGAAVSSDESETRPVVAAPSSASATAAPPLPAAAAPVMPPEPTRCPKPSSSAALTVTGAPSLADVIERANSRVSDETLAAKEFAGVLERQPGAIDQPSVLIELRQHLARPHAAAEALRALAAMQGSVGADLLYEVWTGTKERTDTTELARELVHSREVREKASPALAVALDLRSTESCEDNRTLLASVATHGDRRTIPLLAKLVRNRGCGPTKRSDCYPCLRKGDELTKAIKAVKNRRAPKRLPPR
jgi:hypothetical protein